MRLANTPESVWIRPLGANQTAPKFTLIDLDRTSVLLENPIDDRQSESQAFLVDFCPMFVVRTGIGDSYKRGENLRPLGFGDSRTIILYIDAYGLQASV